MRRIFWWNGERRGKPMSCFVTEKSRYARWATRWPHLRI
ncbi:MAG: PaRep2a protein [Pyrobaculum sp.]|nr:PaRep2a protein [Pyrobaculum sp.]